MASFQITNAMRERILEVQTHRATEKSIKRLRKKLDTLAANYWKQCRVKVEKRLGIPQEDWPGLIQAGILTNRSRIELSEHNMEFLQSQTEQVFKILRLSSFSPLQRYIVHRTGRYSNYAYVILPPDFCCPNYLGHDGIDYESAIGKRAVELIKELREIIDQAISFQDDLKIVLAGIRTSKQMEEIYPEGFKLLPAERKQTNKAIAPVELINSVNERLASGIPV